MNKLNELILCVGTDVKTDSQLNRLLEKTMLLSYSQRVLSLHKQDFDRRYLFALDCQRYCETYNLHRNDMIENVTRYNEMMNYE